MIIKWVNELIEGLSDALLLVLMLLPDTPFNWSMGTGITGILLSHINYFVPFATISTVMASYLLAVVIWYGVRWILRFARYIQ
jgi:hypothetical protein